MYGIMAIEEFASVLNVLHWSLQWLLALTAFHVALTQWIAPSVFISTKSLTVRCSRCGNKWVGATVQNISVF